MATAAEVVETVIAATSDKAMIEILGTGQKGETPLKAKLEKGKAYKARVQAPGFAMIELDVKGGDPKTTAKLVAKPRMIAVSSQPAGAVIFIDGQSTGKTTPSTVELNKAQAARKSVRVGLRKSSYKSVERVVEKRVEVVVAAVGEASERGFVGGGSAEVELHGGRQGDRGGARPQRCPPGRW